MSEEECQQSDSIWLKCVCPECGQPRELAANCGQWLWRCTNPHCKANHSFRYEQSSSSGV